MSLSAHQRRCLVSLVAAAICLSSASATAQHFPSPIPEGHPRIWWNEARLGTARAWYDAHPFEPDPETNPEFSTEPLDNAFKYLLTGDAQYCQVAMGFAREALALIPTSGSTCNECRWWGHDVVTVYDWCYDALSADDRALIMAGANTIVDTFNNVSWGGIEPTENGTTFAENNFFWGYLRNSFLWGVASLGENPSAEGFLTHAVVDRWENVFVPHTENNNGTGITAEGSDYGPYLLDYAVLPLGTADILGRDMMFGETEYFKGSVFATIYQTLPPTYLGPTSSEAKLSIFPFGDSSGYFSADHGSAFVGGPAHRAAIGSFMTLAAAKHGDDTLGAFARGWVRLAEETLGSRLVDRYITAIDTGAATAEFSGLPLDYYAHSPAMCHAYLRTSWGEDATILQLQLMSPPPAGHDHLDGGNWQIWRDGTWLVLEAHGRGQGSGFQVPGIGGEGELDVHETIAHNALLFGGTGQAGGSAAYSTLLRLESTPEAFYAATDISEAYHSQLNNERYGNVNVARVIREFLFVRPLETLVIFDRMESTVSGDQTKTFLMHVQGEPRSIGNNSYISENREQAVRLTTILPDSPTYRVINQSNENYDQSYRIEVETADGTVEHFLHVVQASGRTAPALDLQSSDDGTSVTVTMSHPQSGCATVELAKGMESVGGSFGYAASCGEVVASDLTDEIEVIELTDDGPRWSGTDPAPPEIVSTPILEGYVGFLYRYSVRALGWPVPTYSLTTAPDGMTIDENSGTIEWTPAEAGDFEVTVVAENGLSPDASQVYTLTVTNEMPPNPPNGTGGENGGAGAKSSDGGCGCRTPATGHSSNAWLGGALAGLALCRRRRRRLGG